MITFIICVATLILGYIVYGKYIEKCFGPDDRETPAYTKQDGVDYIPMPTWKAVLIQLLNIAGTGPIFGALSGALFGPIVYIWIVLGCIFAGAVHDYMTGMVSMRCDGASISEITGNYLGNGMRQIMRVFSVILLVMCGVVFTKGPADLLAMLTPKALDGTFWFWVVLIYYFIATFVPIDKVIGRLYPLFGVLLLAMAIGVSGSMMFSGKFVMPELWANFGNRHASGTHVWPFMFITVACGAISGFHATQSPMMARCCKSEKQGRLIFYGAMIAEGIIALIWAAAGVTCYESSQALLEAGAGCSAVVYNICHTTMGKVGCILALSGVIVCPVSSGDTAFRAARITIADWFKIGQSKLLNRLYISVPLLTVGYLISRIDYSIVWRYFSWSNQTLAMIALWAFSVYLFRENKNYYITLLPAVLMSAVTFTYFCSAPECLGIMWNALGVNENTYYIIAVISGIAFAVILLYIYIVYTKKHIRLDDYIRKDKN